MNFHQLVAELGDGQIRPAYLLLGEEPLLRDDALAVIRDAVVPAGTRDFNLDRLSGDTTSVAALRDTVATLPVMAERRLIVLVEPENRRAPSRSRVLLDGLAELVPLLVQTPETVIIVVAARADRRSRWVKAFRDPGGLVACNGPEKTREVVDFIVAEGRLQSVEWASGAAQFLCELVGPQLLLLRQEIAKIALLVPVQFRDTFGAEFGSLLVGCQPPSFGGRWAPGLK